jgi:hypothetical protein
MATDSNKPKKPLPPAPTDYSADPTIDTNEIMPAEGERRPFDKNFVWNYVLLFAILAWLLVLVIVFLVYTFATKELPMRTRMLFMFILAPIIAYCFLLNRQLRYDDKKKIVSIIDEIGGEKITVNQILAVYCPKKPTDDVERRDLIVRITDILWEGYLTEYKYQIAEKTLVKITTTTPPEKNLA